MQTVQIFWLNESYRFLYVLGLVWETFSDKNVFQNLHIQIIIIMKAFYHVSGISFVISTFCSSLFGAMLFVTTKSSISLQTVFIGLPLLLVTCTCNTSTYFFYLFLFPSFFFPHKSSFQSSIQVKPSQTISLDLSFCWSHRWIPLTYKILIFKKTIFMYTFQPHVKCHLVVSLLPNM